LDLHYKQKITLKEALCGFAFELDVRGKKMKIVSGQGKLIVHPNTTKTVPGLGVVRDGVRGNLVISFDIQFPETLSLETIAALEAALTS
jgi:DnaJ-class molecular chaperone